MRMPGFVQRRFWHWPIFRTSFPADALAGAFGAMAGCLADDEGYVRQAATDALALCGDAAVDTLADVLVR